MSAANRTAAQRGFSLVELLVAMFISAIVCAGALFLMTSQQVAFRSSASERGLQETARSALSDVAVNLRRAGYGIEPWLTFDLGPITNAPASWQGGTTLTTTGYPGGAPGTAPPACSPAVAPTDRDSITGADELVFLARNPAFNRRLASAPSSSSLTFATALTSPMYQGQILQVMCNGASQWAYVTVGAFADTGSTAITLQTACTTGFPYQQGNLTAGCFATGFNDVRVFKVDRFHYYLARYADSAVAGTRPYLMLDRGLWKDGRALVEPVAPDVEDVQFAYVFPRSPTAASSLVGATVGTRLASSATSIDLASAPAAFTDPTSAPTRATNSPGNVRGIRVSLVVRSASPEPARDDAAHRTIPAAGNRPDRPGDVGYQRIVVDTTEAVRNMDARGPYYPAYSVNNGADGLNVGGG